MYPIDKTCSWRIVAPPGHQILLTFDPDFSIEAASDREDCNYDVLKIYDGPYENSSLVGEFCGYQAPNPIQSAGNEVLLVFYSDDNTAYDGFRISWASSCQTGMLACDADTCVASEDRCDMEQHCLDWTDELNCNYEVECGDILPDVDEAGNITSMNYPTFYPPGHSCTWIISAPAGQRLAASFTGIFNVSCQTPVSVLSYRMPDNGTGDLPVFDVTDLSEGDVQTLGQPCGKDRPADVFMATAQTLAITFHPSATELPRAGFALSYFFCPLDAFICIDSTCLAMDMVCDGKQDCSGGEDEGAPMCPTTEAPDKTTTLPNDETTRAIEGKITAATDKPTVAGKKTDPPDGKLTLAPRLTTVPGLAGPTRSTDRQTRSPAGNSTVTPSWIPRITAHRPRDTDPGTLPLRRCYSCYGKEDCEDPWADPDISVPVAECMDDEDCWVERIVGPSRAGFMGPDEEVLYRRSCGSKCPPFWHDEACKDGWLQVCSMCCERDLCNRQQLTGEGKSFFHREVSGGVAAPPGQHWPSLCLICFAMFMVSA
ncbi:bone morphogenetic protein 1-like isoform X1 [Branchiostoma lanceolatum]|uniref:bone morphogenetic protein 1-like isoform X1 n=1 Tax=Branchiostoma lanceolatum TaxID=7740 RepID=UPI0034517506